MTSVGRGTGVGGLEHTLPEAPKAAPLRAGGSGPGWFSVSGLFSPQPGAVECSHMLGGRRVGFGECCLFLGMASGFPYLPEPGRGRGGRLGVGTEEARGHFLSDRPYWPDKCPQA